MMDELYIPGIESIDFVKSLNNILSLSEIFGKVLVISMMVIVAMDDLEICFTY